MTSLGARRRMERIARPILGVLATTMALGVVSCSGGATRPFVDPATLVEGIGSAGELRERWEQWRTLGPRSYEYELHRGCFCGGDYVTPAWVEVRDGRVVSARAIVGAVGAARLARNGRLLPLELFEPIDSLFADAIRVSEAGGRLLVSYDPRLGYPARLTIGRPEVDDGVIIAVPSLVAR